jgi:hypothetical protein
MKSLTLLFVALAASFAAGPLRVKYAGREVPLSADPASKFWKAAPPVFATHNNLRVETPGHKTEIRARFTKDNLYVLMVCPYEQLYLISPPDVTKETNKLWEHDAAEIFIGADFENIHQYREYQVSPQGEWVDLDIDTKNPKPEGGWKWDSGMKVKARIDAAAKVWYGEFQIPLKSITAKEVKPGFAMRGNFYRFQGPPPNRKTVAWIPTGRPSNHTPEAFGRIEFEK